MQAASEVCQCVGGVFNTDTDHTDSGMDADLLSDVVAVLDGDGVDKGGDLLVALLLLDQIDNIFKIVILADLLGLGTAWHSPTGGLLHKILEGDYFWR